MTYTVWTVNKRVFSFTSLSLYKLGNAIIVLTLPQCETEVSWKRAVTILFLRHSSGTVWFLYVSGKAPKYFPGCIYLGHSRSTTKIVNRKCNSEKPLLYSF